MIEAGRHGHKKKILRGKHPEILFWALRGYLRSGDDFIDHLSGEGFKLDGTVSFSVFKESSFLFLVGVHCKDIPQHIQ